MIQRDRLAGHPAESLTRRNTVRALALGLFGLAIAPTLALASDATPSGSESAAPEATTRSHVVQRGDTVREIAATYGTTEDALVKLNPALAANPHLIFPGQVLKIPAASEPAHIWSLDLATPNESLPQPESAPRDNATVSGDYPIPTGLATFQTEFLKASIGPAIDSMRATGVPASVTLAQAIIESDWGRSSLATDGKNYFGIKATNKQGSAGSITLPTREAGIGTVIAGFRAYNTMLESFVDHGRFFVENARYAPALAVKDDARAFARAIQQAGYATDPNYATALINVMIRFGLEQYDKLK